MWDSNSKSLVRNIRNHVPAGRPAAGAAAGPASRTAAGIPSVGTELIMVRHSRREEPAEVRDILHAPLTDEGREGARRFGAALSEALSGGRRYRLYHSPVDRCAETAGIMAEALPAGRVEGVEEAKFLFRVQARTESFARYMQRDGNNIINHWLAGHYPPAEIQAPLEFAQSVRQAWQSLQDLHDPGVTSVFVSHDLHTAVCLYLWTGIFRGSENMIEPMDGFYLEDRGHELTVVTRDGAKTLAPPYWWNYGSDEEDRP
ncbi:MAG: histidine phosphatase family protein [Spirochaetaceae bacterium]